MDNLPFSRIILIALSTSLWGLACDQTISVPPPGEITTIEVVYNEGEPIEVDLANLEVVHRDGEEFARLSDIVEAAELEVSLEDLLFDFEAADGFRSSSTSTCTEVIPMQGELLLLGYVHRITGNLDWDVEPELPGCVSRLREMSRIWASDEDNS